VFDCVLELKINAGENVLEKGEAIEAIDLAVKEVTYNFPNFVESCGLIGKINGGQIREIEKVIRTEMRIDARITNFETGKSGPGVKSRCEKLRGAQGGRAVSE
jgi:hypothetical protein